MTSIFSSKLYKASNHKERVRAAWSNPLNAELVTQLRSYLDDEYLDPKYLDTDAMSEDLPDVSKDEKIIDDNIDSKDKDKDSESTKGNPTEPQDNGSFSNLNPESDTSEETEETSEDTSEELEESTAVKHSRVFASSGYVDELLAGSADSIKGMLNSRSDTCGVSRIQIKDRELWIHYNDNVNLNTIMEPVIALMNSSGYSKLNFNRLARTENAIVFFFDEVSQPMKPLDADA